MKKLILAQTLLLAVAAVLGISMKTGMVPDVIIAHKTAGMAAGLIGLLILVMAFRDNYDVHTKGLSAIALVLTLSAAMGGMTLATSANYDNAYMQMAGSGFAALVVSIVLFFKSKKAPKKSSKKK